MLPDNKIKCPATGFKTSCRAIVSKYDCPKFVKISGTNPNDGQPVDRYGCVDSFLPMLLIENSQQQRSTAAAVESLRNETVQGLGMVAEATQMAAISPGRHMRLISPSRREVAESF